MNAARIIEPGSLTAEKIVRQRAGGDCMIAALATVLCLSYDETARLLGFSVDAKKQLLADGDVIFSNELAFPLFKLGIGVVFLNCPGGLVGEMPSGRKPMLPSSSDLRAAGHVGVIEIIDGSPDAPLHERFHALAWDGQHLFDCRNAASVDLSNAEITSANLLFSLKGSS